MGARTATTAAVSTSTPASSPAPVAEPICSSSISPPTTTRRLCCPSARTVGGRLHLRPEPQGQPQELDGWAEHHHRREARRRDRGVRLHRHLARRLPHEPLHPLGWTPAEAKPGGARPDEEGG